MYDCGTCILPHGLVIWRALVVELGHDLGCRWAHGLMCSLVSSWWMVLMFFFGSVLELGSQWSWESYELFVGSSKRQDVSSVVIDSVTAMS